MKSVLPLWAPIGVSAAIELVRHLVSHCLASMEDVAAIHRVRRLVFHWLASKYVVLLIKFVRRR